MNLNKFRKKRHYYVLIIFSSERVFLEIVCLYIYRQLNNTFQKNIFLDICDCAISLHKVLLLFVAEMRTIPTCGKVIEGN